MYDPRFLDERPMDHSFFEHFRLLSTGCFKAEREVYDRLRALQGSAIPRLVLTTGTVLPSDSSRMRSSSSTSGRRTLLLHRILTTVTRALPSLRQIDLIYALKYQKIVIFKTAYYSFYLPVALAMYMCGIPLSSAPVSSVSSASFSTSSNDSYAISVPIGEYFQVRAQRLVLDNGYEVKDGEAETRVKALYENLEIGGRVHCTGLSWASLRRSPRMVQASAQTV
ncbi:hypothetical protein GSI_03503 [Ganoderma sinense ZZ0214-1]|uniref:Uncharacterized protein n=1 Tax=Ganoderma sinense ZZ0214-1 TaxID=1077348 RepID=A0A2G8SLT9_9APHY|nr:hypothetical protein GSI_03503 [Ganoderma sinense ZZ0214-1]